MTLVGVFLSTTGVGENTDQPGSGQRPHSLDSDG